MSNTEKFEEYRALGIAVNKSKVAPDLMAKISCVTGLYAHGLADDSSPSEEELLTDLALVEEEHREAMSRWRKIIQLAYELKAEAEKL